MRGAAVCEFGEDRFSVGPAHIPLETEPIMPRRWFDFLIEKRLCVDVRVSRRATWPPQPPNAGGNRPAPTPVARLYHAHSPQHWGAGARKRLTSTQRPSPRPRHAFDSTARARRYLFIAAAGLLAGSWAGASIAAQAPGAGVSPPAAS